MKKTLIHEEKQFYEHHPPPFLSHNILTKYFLQASKNYFKVKLMQSVITNYIKQHQTCIETILDKDRFKKQHKLFPISKGYNFLIS